MSEVGFEPTPTFVDQNAHSIQVKSISLESGALDRSAILTLHSWPKKFQVSSFFWASLILRFYRKCEEWGGKFTFFAYQEYF